MSDTIEDPTLTTPDPEAEIVPGTEDPATDPAAEPVDGDVTPPAEDPALTPAVDPADVPENTVPLSRLNEVIEERNALRETTSSLTRQVETLTTMVTKVQGGEKVTVKEQDKAQDALDGLITAGEITRDEANKLQKIVDAMGYARKSNEEDPEIKTLKETVKQLQQDKYLDQDAKELQATLKKYEGIVDAPKIEAKMKEYAQSRDPELMRLAREGSYEDIVRKGFFSEIVQAEAAKLTKGKPTAAPKIDPSKQEPVKKPDTKEIVYDPADPKAYDRAVRAAVIAKVRERAE